LHIADGFGGGSGTLRGWSLFLHGTACSTGSGICDFCLPAIINAVTSTDPVQTGRGIGNIIMASCGAPEIWSGTSVGSFHHDIYSFANTSPAVAYTPRALPKLTTGHFCHQNHRPEPDGHGLDALGRYAFSDNLEA
jgi:hypothetical protein